MRLIHTALVLALAGCAASGTKVDQAQLDGLEVGKTTKSQVLAELGPPSNHSRNADGTSGLTYNYSQMQMQPQNFIPVVGSLVGGAEHEHTIVTLQFDSQGILEDYSASEGTGELGTGLISGQKQ